jgi:hypothetical protein
MASQLKARTPLKRQTPLRRTEKLRPRSKRKGGYFKRCDKLWGEIIHARDRGCCQVCGATNHVQAHHLIPKQNYFFRHNVENGILLCYQHHIASPKCSAHGAPELFRDWLAEHHPEVYEWLTKNYKALHKVKTDYKQVYFMLVQLKESLMP